MADVPDMTKHRSFPPLMPSCEAVEAVKDSDPLPCEAMLVINDKTDRASFPDAFDDVMEF